MSTLEQGLPGKLLAALSPEAPAGRSIHYETAWLELQEARREDDPNLPAGIWQTELKRAQWDEVERLASALLAETSKDLMVAAWLGEAWLHRHGCVGLRRAVELIMGLCRDFWDCLHPLPQNEDIEYRITPLAWLDGCYAELVARIQLWPASETSGEALSLQRWKADERTRALPVVKGAKNADEVEQAIALVARQREELRRQLAAPAALQKLQEQASHLATARQDLTEFEAFLSRQLADAAPGFPRLRDSLQQLQGLITELIDMCPPRPPLPAAPCSPPSDSGLPGAAQAHTGRDELYRQLAGLSEQLARLEPHSPVPYLLRKAIDWGRKPLDEILLELNQEDSQARRLWSVMGILREDRQ